MRARQPRRLQYGVGRRGAIESGDVLGDGAIEQSDVLRQIADVAAEIVGRPLAKIRAIQSDVPPASRPYSDEGFEQRRFAGRTTAEQSNCCSGMERERDVRNDDGL